jgi:hypothetical protein
LSPRISNNVAPAFNINAAPFDPSQVPQPNLIAPGLLNSLNQFLLQNQPVPLQQQQVEVEQAAVEQNIPEVL